MSLDVYLELPPGSPVEGDSHSGIFIREDGQTKEISTLEWYQRMAQQGTPDREPIAFTREPDPDEPVQVYHGNITHNLGEMAAAVHIEVSSGLMGDLTRSLYDYLWRPDEIGIEWAEQLIYPLGEGLAELVKSPLKYEPFNPENGWGDLQGLVRFTLDYLIACQHHPDAKVTVSR